LTKSARKARCIRQLFVEDFRIYAICAVIS